MDEREPLEKVRHTFSPSLHFLNECLSQVGLWQGQSISYGPISKDAVEKIDKQLAELRTK